LFGVVDCAIKVVTASADWPKCNQTGDDRLDIQRQGRQAHGLATHHKHRNGTRDHRFDPMPLGDALNTP